MLIIFFDDDVGGIPYPHDDTLVVAMDIALHNVARIVVDTESSANITFVNALWLIYIKSVKMRPWRTPLVGFVGEIIMPEGIVSLSVTITNSYHHVVHLVNFFIIYRERAYNCIISCL